MRARLLGSLPKKLKKLLGTRGGLHDHPSSLNALYRIKMILLGKNPSMVHTHSNIGIEEEEYLLASAMKRKNWKYNHREARGHIGRCS
ncbi:hypothetical protein NQ314_001925 [Rhamnusium bicolor]|uniref:Uncharacterized protein n=1 Tax=Rhamnusium bicolor TaxID=1586634 RepID=A0AAV8ZS67_9CUCU|nr:hypothetical protein NQ314_001925 [Rhamnusium bicolor]